MIVKYFHKIQKKFLENESLIFSIAFFIQIILGICILQLRSQRTTFDVDEFQHAHIAWNILQGKLIYRDFFEHHGALAGYFNAIILWIRGGDAASFETFYVLRQLTFFLLCLQGLVVYSIIKSFISSREVALGGVVLFFANNIMMIFGYAMRPDSLQNLFNLLGLLFVVKKRYWTAGFFMGLAWAAHPKAIIFITFLLSSMFIIELQSKETIPIFKKHIKVIAGIFIVVLTLLIFFTIQGGGYDFLKATMFHNFKSVVGFYEIRGKMLVYALWKESRVQFVLTIVALLLVFFRRKTFLSQEFRIISLTTLLSFSLLLFPLFGQLLLIVLPLMAISITVAFYKVFGSRIASFFLIPLGFYLIWSHQSFLKPNRSQYNELQKSELNFVLKNLKRDEKMAYVWPSHCAAYVFNSDVDRYWMLGINNKWLTDSTSTENFNRVFKTQILTGEVNYVIVHPKYLKYLTQKMRNYLQNNFNQRGCIWIRN
jgi:Gpi18-like mannosyltransferase